MALEQTVSAEVNADLSFEAMQAALGRRRLGRSRSAS